MHAPDDRLAGDPIWELFPAAPPTATSRHRRILTWLGIAFIWYWLPPVSVILACLAVSLKDVRDGRQLARSIPDKTGGRICMLFTYAWGACKFGLAAFTLMFVSLLNPWVPFDEGMRRVAGFAVAMLFGLGGFHSSAILTAAGLELAFRSGMRVWIGEGINRARTLLIAMLSAGFFYLVMLPWGVWLARIDLREGAGPSQGPAVLLGFLGSMLAGPVAILIVLDRISPHVVADRPGKFGPKVPTVGKWHP